MKSFSTTTGFHKSIAQTDGSRPRQRRAPLWGKRFFQAPATSEKPKTEPQNRSHPPCACSDDPVGRRLKKWWGPAGLEAALLQIDTLFLSLREEDHLPGPAPGDLERELQPPGERAGTAWQIRVKAAGGRPPRHGRLTVRYKIRQGLMPVRAETAC